MTRTKQEVTFDKVVAHGCGLDVRFKPNKTSDPVITYRLAGNIMAGYLFLEICIIITNSTRFCSRFFK